MPKPPAILCVRSKFMGFVNAKITIIVAHAGSMNRSRNIGTAAPQKDKCYNSVRN
jgi:hypothetical protein